MGKQQDENLWAVVFSGGGKYLCKLDSEFTIETTREAIEEGLLIGFQESYEILTHSIPAQGGTTLMRRVVSTPVVQTMAPTPLFLLVTGIQFIEDMQPEDRRRYKALVESARKTAEEAQRGKMDA